MVNNAGTAGEMPSMEEPDEVWLKIINLNLNSVFVCCREFAKEMVKNKLQKERFIELSPNPEHKRAALVSATPKGKVIYDDVQQMFDKWTEDLSITMSGTEILATEKVLEMLAVQFMKDINGNYKHYMNLKRTTD